MKKRVWISSALILIAATIVSGSGALAHHKDGHAGGPPPPRAFAPIQPGGLGSRILDGCTHNFVFHDDRDLLYIGTAGHCASNVGLEVGDEVRLHHDGSRIGEFAFIHPPSVRFVGESPVLHPDQFVSGFDLDDFALIAIDAERYEDVSPMVRQWGGPTGIPALTEPQPGDVVAMYGHGLGVPHEAGGRQGILESYDEKGFGALFPVSRRDSGSPVIHAGTGKAIGVVLRIIGSRASEVVAGLTVERALELAADGGFEFKLVTAHAQSSAGVHLLGLSKEGYGGGTVTSDSEGIDCGEFCSSRLAEGAYVVLTATADDDSTVSGWSGPLLGVGCLMRAQHERREAGHGELRSHYAARSGPGVDLD